MFAGKTEELLRRVRRYKYGKKKVYVFKPTVDTRLPDALRSHNMDTILAISVNSAAAIAHHLDHAEAPHDAVVLIDECQFFSDAEGAVMELVNHGHTVIIGCLDQNFRKEPWDVVGRLLAHAHEVMKLTAVCLRCGDDAYHTQRLVEGEPARYDAPLVMIGASEAYEARCGQCHIVAGIPQQASPGYAVPGSGSIRNPSFVPSPTYTCTCTTPLLIRHNPTGIHEPTYLHAHDDLLRIRGGYAPNHDTRKGDGSMFIEGLCRQRKKVTA
jgi:thymidine kinase